MEDRDGGAGSVPKGGRLVCSTIQYFRGWENPEEKSEQSEGAWGHITLYVTRTRSNDDFKGKGGVL